MTHPLGHNLFCRGQREITSDLAMVLQSVSHPLMQELQQKEQQWRRRCEELQAHVQQLQEDREELQSRLKGSHAQEGRSKEKFIVCEMTS